VRRSTGDKVLTLTDGYSADLDSTDPSWDVKYDENQYKDIELYYRGLIAENGDMAVVSGAPRYETCRDATAYQAEIEESALDSGLKVCIRTSEKRHAFVTVKKVTDEGNRVQLDVVVWDPPFE
jgi:hypothetical protein